MVDIGNASKKGTHCLLIHTSPSATVGRTQEELNRQAALPAALGAWQDFLNPLKEQSFSRLKVGAGDISTSLDNSGVRLSKISIRFPSNNGAVEVRVDGVFASRPGRSEFFHCFGINTLDVAADLQQMVASFKPID